MQRTLFGGGNVFLNYLSLINDQTNQYVKTCKGIRICTTIKLCSDYGGAGRMLVALMPRSIQSLTGCLLLLRLWSKPEM